MFDQVRRDLRRGPFQQISAGRILIQQRLDRAAQFGIGFGQYGAIQPRRVVQIFNPT